jgi:diguanylate cyclase (GGDEF)-like protein/PAS domain S-box-containing protein
MNYREILDSVADGVYFVDRERRITFWNRAAAEISGHSDQDVLGKLCPEGAIQHVDANGQPMCHEYCPLTAVLKDGQARQEEAYLHHRDGHRVPVRVRVRPLRSETGQVIGAVETFTDISNEIESQRRAADLERQAFIDVLTGLGNRRFAEHQIERALAEQARHGRRFGLLMVDVDHFKTLNDRWGHASGDAALRGLARTFSAAARSEDFVSRWGGEEFLVLVRHDELRGVTAAAERLRRMVQASSVRLGETSVHLTVSVGATLSREGEDATALVARADALCYQSKRDGRNRVTSST